MIKAVSDSIIHRLCAYTPLNGELSGRMYFQMAPQDSAFPYCAFMFINIGQDEIMGGASDNITLIDLQFSIFSDSEGGGEEIASLTETLKDCYHWFELIIDGWTCLKMQRENVLPILYIDEIWQSTSEFSLWIQSE